VGREVVHGRYELLEVLGREGATDVVRAIDRQHDRTVALKVRRLTPDVSREQLLAEGRALLGLRSHPALPTVREDFFLDDDSYVLVMDWVEGTPLQQFVAERGDPGLPLGTVLEGLKTVAAALDHLHEHDPPVFHGDVRPENILVGPGGRLTLVFSVGSIGSVSTTLTGPYRAPELGASPPSRASDVYGMAATTVYALTGSPPTRGAPIEWTGVPPELAKRLDRIIRRALEADPSRRPPSASAFVERLATARESEVPTGVVTFVLTDVEGSTDLWEAHPDAMAKVMLRHYEIAADIAETYGGRMPRTQGEGDSTLTAFARATDAVDAICAFQRAITDEPWPQGIVLRVRAGLHSGEAQVEHGEYFGATLSRAARVRALARGGQVFCSQATAELVADRLPADCTLTDLGSVRLKGLERAEEVYALWAPGFPDIGPSAPLTAAVDLPARLPFPTTLHADATGFVGRDDALGALREQWRACVEEPRRHVALVGGDPGIGKSRLAAEHARRLYLEGATVLHGRCYEENVAPYQPFVEAIEHVVRNGAPEEVREDIIHSGTLLARLVPDIELRFDELPPPVRGEPGTERYLMFEAVSSMLCAIAMRAPLLLVLDDLHWADRPTIALLVHVARSADAAPILVLGTYRPGDIDPDHPLCDALAELRRDGLVDEVELTGLTEEQVGQLVAGTCDHGSSAAFVRSVSRETAGNPFFVREICTHVDELGARADAFTLSELGVPEGVKQVIRQRVSRLPEGSARLLTIGAVIGREFELDLLLQVSGEDEDSVLDLLDHACAARLLEEVPKTIDRYSFVHALGRETLYESLSTARRARLHRRVAEAIETRHAADLEEHLGELAFHYAAAGTEPMKAVEYARRAGEQSLARLAHEEAAAQFQRGLALLDAVDRDRCDLLLGLAEAKRRAADVPGSTGAFAEAAGIARSLGDAERLARAAVGNFRGHVLATPGWHEPTIGLLEEALVALPDADSALRARVLAALSLELYFTPQQTRGVTTAHEAIALARRLEDDEALAFALACAHTAISDPGHVEERLETSTELIEVGQRLGSAELALVGHVHRAADLLELTRIDDARAEAEVAADIVEQLGQPVQRYHVLWLQATHALLAGELDESTRLADEALEIGLSGDHPDAYVAWGTQALMVAWQRGDTRHLIDPARNLLKEFPDLSAWPAAVALVELTAGEIDDAHERLRSYAADLDRLDFSAIWLAAMLSLTEVARVCEDREAAAALLERLAPYADRWCVVSLNLSEVGPVARAVGVLTTLTGDHDEAERRFEQALSVSRAAGARPHVARTSVDYARMLLARGATGDEDRARALISEARELATAIGMAGLVRDIDALVGQ
jgi:class 3 adenylate cyclase/tetratricopeptide (TPR) repeat protein